jgi:hypothetical protein
MALELKIETRPDYLLMTYKGLYVQTLAHEFTDQVLEACVRHRPAKVLIDFREVTGVLTTMERFAGVSIAVTKYLTARLSGTIRACRFVMIAQPPLMDPQRFEETVALNRGLNFRIFSKIEDGIAWFE